MSRVTGVGKPDLSGGGCWALIERHTGKLWAQSTNCGKAAREGALTCRYHEKYEGLAQRAQARKAQTDAALAAGTD